MKLRFSSDGNFWQTDKQSSGLTSEWTASQFSGSNFQWSNRQKVKLCWCYVYGGQILNHHHLAFLEVVETIRCVHMHYVFGFSEETGLKRIQ